MTELETANKRIAALEAELAAMRATGAPVAWGVFATIGGRILSSAPTTQELAESIAKNIKTPTEVRPLYTHPQPAAQGRELFECVACKHLYETADVSCDCFENKGRVFTKWVAYLNNQPAAQDAGRKPLTAVAAMHLVMDVDMQGCYVRGTTNWAVAITRAIECAHGITAQQGSK